MRRKTCSVHVGSVSIGSDFPISIQSMTNTDTRDVIVTSAQIKRVADSGCEIVRVAVPDKDSALALKKIQRDSPIPIIADIHFDYKLALESIKSGVDGLRINPGNIGSKNKVEEVVLACKDKKIPIRVGVNAGSIEKELWKKYGAPTSEAMVESALNHIQIFEDLNFYDIKISLKASDIQRTVSAYRLLAKKVNYPFHIGVSEAGVKFAGTIKSAIGIGILLSEGIGDTVRVSLTGDPVEEVKVALQILKSLGIRNNTPEIISCPTCGRCEINLIELAEKTVSVTEKLNKNIKIAVMGCVVNGPGEAREADVGITGGKGVGLVFRKGEIVRKVKETELFDALMEEIKKI